MNRILPKVNRISSKMNRISPKVKKVIRWERVRAPKYENSYKYRNIHYKFKVKVGHMKMALEQYEMLMVKMATLKLHPRMYSDGYVAKKLGVNIATIKKLRRNHRYIEIVENMLAEVRSQWKGEIQGVIINRALKGSPAHIDFFYNLDKEFVNKSGPKHREDIPTDPVEKKKLIEKLLAETQLLDKAPVVSEKIPVKSKLSKTKTDNMEIRG